MVTIYEYIDRLCHHSPPRLCLICHYNRQAEILIYALEIVCFYDQRFLLTKNIISIARGSCRIMFYTKLMIAVI